MTLSRRRLPRARGGAWAAFADRAALRSRVPSVRHACAAPRCLRPFPFSVWRATKPPAPACVKRSGSAWLAICLAESGEKAAATRLGAADLQPERWSHACAFKLAYTAGCLLFELNARAFSTAATRVLTCSTDPAAGAGGGAASRAPPALAHYTALLLWARIAPQPFTICFVPTARARRELAICHSRVTAPNRNRPGAAARRRQSAAARARPAKPDGLSSPTGGPVTVLLLAHAKGLGPRGQGAPG